MRRRLGRFLPALLILGGCATPLLKSSSGPTAPKTVSATTPIAAAVASVVRPKKTMPVFPERKPQLGITTPLKGELPPAEAKLATSTCEKATNEDVELRLKDMRAAVDAQFKVWHDAQPDCWEQMREEWRWRKEEEALRARGNMWGEAMMDAAGSGSLGLGSVGTLGHGAGTGTGAGYGRLAGQHASGPTIRMGSAAGPAQAVPDKAKKASGTNTQVVGVDEADLVKTDGRYVYFAVNGALRIVEAMNPKLVSVTNIPGNVREMFIEGDRAVVYSSSGRVGHRCTYGYDCQFAGDGSTTKISVLELGSDRKEPRVVRQIDLSGSLMSARMIGSAIHTVVADNDSPAPPFVSWPVGMGTCGVPEADVKAKFAALKKDNEKAIRAKTTVFPTLKDQGKEQIMCGGILRTAARDGQAFTSVVSFNLEDSSAPKTATVQSRPGAVFASGDALYMSVTHPGANEVSDIHKFKIGAKADLTRYTGSGRVPGHVLNQFAMDEWYGYLRVATTKGKVPNPNVESVVSVLAENDKGGLVRVGMIDKIAPGEDIRSVRFEGDRGYIVTFKKTDPLFVMDLFNPQAPAVLGELKIPGFSTYMHRIDPNHLLSIGFDANDHGDFAYFDGVILQLFDVANPRDPRLMHKEKIGTRGSSSEAATNHLAFNYMASEGLLAVPMTVCEGGGDGRNGDQVSFSGLLVYDVDVEKGFTKLGGVDHAKGGTCSTWWSAANSHVKRSVFLDDLVYSVALDRVKVQRMNAFGLDVADITF